MSKFGFQNAPTVMIHAISLANRAMADETLKHFMRNFDKEAWGSVKWEPTVRKNPPPILNVTGKLRGEVNNGLTIVSYRSFKIEADPIDGRGRGYAIYHNEGTPMMPRRAFAKQDDTLTRTQLRILAEYTGEIWQRLS